MRKKFHRKSQLNQFRLFREKLKERPLQYPVLGKYQNTCKNIVLYIPSLCE